jgi:hypothetical protein
MGLPMTVVADPASVDLLIEPVPAPAESERGSRVFEFILQLILQLSHRIAIGAFLLAAGTGFLLFKASASFGYVLIGVVGASDVAILLAGTALILARHRPAQRREARGLLIFNGIILALAVYTMVFTRLTWIRVALHPLTSAPQDVELPK